MSSTLKLHVSHIAPRREEGKNEEQEEDLEIREEYKKTLQSKEANTFYSVEESKRIFEDLKSRAK